MRNGQRSNGRRDVIRLIRPGDADPNYIPPPALPEDLPDVLPDNLRDLIAVLSDEDDTEDPPSDTPVTDERAVVPAATDPESEREFEVFERGPGHRDLFFAGSCVVFLALVTMSVLIFSILMALRNDPVEEARGQLIEANQVSVEPKAVVEVPRVVLDPEKLRSLQMYLEQMASKNTQPACTASRPIPISERLPCTPGLLAKTVRMDDWSLVLRDVEADPDGWCRMTEGASTCLQVSKHCLQSGAALARGETSLSSATCPRMTRIY